MRYADRVNAIAGESDKSWEVHMVARKRVDAGERIIQLTIGDHDLGAPATAVEATIKGLKDGLHHYTNAGGEPRLLDAVFKHCQSRHYPHLKPEQVVVVPGAQNGLYSAGMCLFNPGDVVLVPEPYYATYMPAVQASGAIAKLVPLRPENDFHLDNADLEAAYAAATGTVRGVLINSPHNPTGVVMRPETVTAVSDFIKANDLWLISDEVYQDLIYRGEHISPWNEAGMSERTIVLGSFSKSFGMTGWRLGWVIGPELVVSHIRELAGCMLFGLPPFVQDAGATVIEHADEIIPVLHERYGSRAKAAVEGLSRINGLRYHHPDAGMFVMFDVSPFGLAPRDFALRLLAEEDVAILPADGFGPSASGYLRMSLSAPVDGVSEACERLSRFVSRL